MESTGGDRRERAAVAAHQGMSRETAGKRRTEQPGSSYSAEWFRF